MIHTVVIIILLLFSIYFIINEKHNATISKKNLTKENFTVLDNISGKYKVSKEKLMDSSRSVVSGANAPIIDKVIDDINSKTLVSAASIEPQIRNEHSSSNKSVVAKAVGELLAKRLQDNGIKQLVFDRGGYKFHGRVKALADGVKSMGVQI